MKRWVACVWVFVLLSCVTEYKPEHAVGELTELVVITNKDIFQTYMDELDTIFSKPLYLPSKEEYFDYYYGSMVEFNKYRFRRNILIIGRLGEPLIDTLLPPEYRDMVASGEDFIFGYKDLFTAEQNILIIAVPSWKYLHDVLQKNGETIFNYFFNGVRRTLRGWLYGKGYNVKLSDYIKEKYHFAIKIPYGWQISFEDPAGKTIGFIRHMPERMIVIHWEDEPLGGWLTVDEIIALRNELGKKYLYGDYVDTSMTRTYFVQFAGYYAQKVEGIWQNDERVEGGPFRTYIFGTDTRTYVIDFHVFAPGEKKWYRLEQLELIVETFQPIL